MTIVFSRGGARLEAGNLDRRIAIQRKSSTLSPSGEPVDTWTTLVIRWAAVKPLSGAEISAPEQWFAKEASMFTIRWDNTVKSVSPLDRIIFPATDVGSSPIGEQSIYDILLVHEVGRNDLMNITAVRQAAVLQP